MINTRKRTILRTFLVILTTCVTSYSLLTPAPSTPHTQEQVIDLTLPSHESKTYKKRMRKKTDKRKKEKKIESYKDMTYDELAIAKDNQIAKGNISAGIKYLDQMMKLCTDISKLAEHLLQVSDLFFQEGQYLKAARLYTEFSSLYPGSDKQEYALYRAIASSFACILSTDRDQTQTEETVGLTEIFLIQDHFAAYREEVIQIQLQCYEKLALSECNVCSFYLTRDKFSAAEKRLKQLRSKWLPKVPTLESEIIALETTLADKKEVAELRELKNKERSETKELLAQNKTKKRMADRF